MSYNNFFLKYCLQLTNYGGHLLEKIRIFAAIRTLEIAREITFNLVLPAVWMPTALYVLFSYLLFLNQIEDNLV